MVPSGQAVEKPASPEPEPRSWPWLVSFLCFYGFMVQMRPGESFITPYLLGPTKNFTQQQARGAARGRAGQQAAAGAAQLRRPRGVRGPALHRPTVSRGAEGLDRSRSRAAPATGGPSLSAG